MSYHSCSFWRACLWVSVSSLRIPPTTPHQSLKLGKQILSLELSAWSKECSGCCFSFPFMLINHRAMTLSSMERGQPSIERWQSFTTELAKVLVYQNMTRCLCLPSWCWLQPTHAGFTFLLFLLMSHSEKVSPRKRTDSQCMISGPFQWRQKASRSPVDPWILLTGLNQGPAGDKAALWH